MSAAWVVRALAASALAVLAAGCADEVLRLLRRQRRWAWLGGLLATTVLPWIAPWLPLPRFGAWLARDAVPAVPAWLAAMAAGGGRGAAAEAPALDPAVVAGLAWGAASLVMVAVLVASATRVRRRAARWRRERVDGVEVRVSPAAGPMVVGWVRPAVVVPEWVLAAPLSERALILAHESEHVAARDPLLLALAGLLTVLTPWNPFLWLQRRLLRARVEIDCDARVLARGVDRRGYGELLLRTAAGPRPRPAYGLFLLNPATLLERRIRAMTEARSKLRRVKGTLAALAGAAALAAACDVAGAGRAAPTEVAARRPGASKMPTSGPQAPVILIDGKIASGDAVQQLAPERIASVSVHKGPAVDAGARGRLGAALPERLGTAGDGGFASRAAREREEVLRRAVANGIVTITTRAAPIDGQSGAERRKVLSTAAGGRERGVVQRRRADATPVFMVDGRIVPADVATALDRERIASVDVIKGAAAARSYGAAGENGVVRITTKK